jgi:hypothetical protein
MKKKVFYIIGIFLILSLSTLFFLKKSFEDKEEETVSTEVSNIIACEGDCTLRLLDGMPVATGRENPFLISAIIDNNDLARPQFSLSKASLVYDVPAEGGIDRYLAFWPSDLNEDLEIGPIRSVRPYFLSIASEYESLLLHCGGSPEALANISKKNLLTLNEFYNSDYYRRYSNYQAPHNVLANYKKIVEYLNDRNLTKSNFIPWKFKTKDLISIATDTSNINYRIDIKNGQYQYDSSWEYNTSSRTYLKSIAGKDHVDNTESRIEADNIILQFVSTEILDSALRLKIDLIGQGQAVICLDGTCGSGIWKKNNESDRTIFYYNNGEEIILNSGKTWVVLIDESTSVEIENFSF